LISERDDLPAYESVSQESSTGEEQQGMEMSSDLHKTDKADLSATEEARQLQAQAKPGFFESLKVFRDPQFLALTMAEMAASIGYLIPLYYMQSKQTPLFQFSLICNSNDMVHKVDMEFLN